MTCIADDYIKFVNNFLYNYYKMLLGNKYEKKMIASFVEKYIDIRYYNNGIYSSGTVVDKINMELKLVAKELIKQDMNLESLVKNIFSLFAYVLYIDDCDNYSSLSTLLNTLYEDKNIILSDDLNKNDFKEFVKDFINQKNEFFKNFEINNFFIKEKRLGNNFCFVDLQQNCNISPLYSEYAIKRAYDSEVVVENKTYLLILLLSSYVLKNAINLNYTKNYVVDFPESLFEKNTKINKYLKALDNNLLKDKIHFRLKYKSYLKYKDKINSYIRDGYSFSIILDETFEDDVKSLIIFSCVFVYEKYDYYDIIINSRDSINTNIITL